MSTTNVAFSTEIDAWVAETKARREAVFRKSSERLAEAMKDPANIPIKTGFLRRSLKASTAAMPQIDPDARPAPGGTYADDGSAIAVVIANAGIDDTIYLGFTAAYAARQNYGFTGTDSLGRQFNQAGRGFVDLAVQRWPQIVGEAAEELKARVGARAK